APSYRRTALWWVMSAKKEETRQKRLATLIQDSENGRLLANFLRPSNTRSG
ncbi:MAG TPA: YdeI/OmpD-associated family protein, partial [Chloroflexia bacterium]